MSETHTYANVKTEADSTWRLPLFNEDALQCKVDTEFDESINKLERGKCRNTSVLLTSEVKYYSIFMQGYLMEKSCSTMSTTQRCVTGRGSHALRQIVT